MRKLPMEMRNHLPDVLRDRGIRSRERDRRATVDSWASSSRFSLVPKEIRLLLLLLPLKVSWRRIPFAVIIVGVLPVFAIASRAINDRVALSASFKSKITRNVFAHPDLCLILLIPYLCQESPLLLCPR